MWTPQPIISSTACQQIIEAARARVIASQRSTDYLGQVDYRSVALQSCGPELQQLVVASGAVQAATDATDTAYRVDEDIMIARTIQCPEQAAAEGNTSLINMHHDRHKNDGRVATFMIYLSTVSSGNGGETFFPCAAGLGKTKETDQIADALDRQYREGERSLRRGTTIVAQCEERLQAWRAGSSNHGVGAAADEGTAIVFDAAPVAAAWHGPCAVTGTDEKWTLTFFKSPAPLWSSLSFGP